MKSVNWLYSLNSDERVFQNSEWAVSLLNNEIFSYETNDNGTLTFKFYDGQVYNSIRHEVFTENELYPKCVPASESSIGNCLQQWNLGCKRLLYKIDDKETFIGVTINTRKHMYIFEITPWSIYCRSARYFTCDKGVVFNQNFRQGVEAYMLENNSKAMEELIIDESLFSDKACSWDNMSVYWSVFSIEDNVITLHGCQGDTYKWERPI